MMKGTKSHNKTSCIMLNIVSTYNIVFDNIANTLMISIRWAHLHIIANGT